MKKVFLMAIAIAAVLMSCSNDYGFLDKAPQKEEPKEDPTPNTPTDTTVIDPYAWANIVARELNCDENREVQSKIIAQRNNGEKDSTILRYFLDFCLSAPDTVRLTKAGTEMTVYTGTLSFPGKEYTPTKWENCDSAIVVTTTKGYKTNYYDVTWKTSHVNGWILFKGHMEPYKNSEETTTFTQPSLYKGAYEVVRNDSVYLREEVKHEVKMSFLKRTFSYEKKVVVDHFLRMKEKVEPKEEPKDETAEFDIPDYVGVQAYVRSYDVIKKRWNDAILIDAKEAYYVVTIPFTYNKEKDKEQVITSNGKVEKHITQWLKAEVGETKEYSGVLNYQGTFYPAAMTVDAYGWYCVFNMTIDQSIDMNQATISGLKNQPKNGNAKGSPYVSHAESKSASGQVVTITGTTIGHTISTTLKIK